MSRLLVDLLNLSISATWIVLSVILLRLIFKKAPKWIFVAIWGLVAVKLLCPFTIVSPLSLQPTARTIVASANSTDTTVVTSGFTTIDNTINPVLNELQNGPQVFSWDKVAVAAWIAGMVLLLGYLAVSTIILKRKVRFATKVSKGVYESEMSMSPFILGVFKPVIYLPIYMTKEERSIVLAHERAHIARRDYLIKPFAYLLLSIYWFNPVMWVAYVLLCKDIEMACDEKVLRENGMGIKKNYADVLLSFSTSQRKISACPVAFGEKDPEKRIKNVLTYKKPIIWVVGTVAILAVAVAVCFLTTPESVAEESIVEEKVLGKNTAAEKAPGENVAGERATLEAEEPVDLPISSEESEKMGDDIIAENSDEALAADGDTATAEEENFAEGFAPASNENGQIIQLESGFIVTGTLESTGTHITIASPKGTPVYACMSGTVISAEYDYKNGNKVEVKNDDGTVIYYTHLDTMSVSAGATVNAGDSIGTVGASGLATGPCLGLWLLENDTAEAGYIDPIQYVPTAFGK